MVPLNGLILCGGNSSRLGFPKYTLVKNDKLIYQWWHDLLQNFCEEVFISCKPSQVINFNNFKCITDAHEDAGPLEGIYQAFHCVPGTDWLVVACDLVFLKPEHIQELTNNRNREVDAIAYYNSKNDSPFPLCCVYKSTLVEKLNREYQSELKSPRRLLKENNTLLLHNPDQKILDGINTPEELKAWVSGNNSH